MHAIVFQWRSKKDCVSFIYLSRRQRICCKLNAQYARAPNSMHVHQAVDTWSCLYFLWKQNYKNGAPRLLITSAGGTNLTPSGKSLKVRWASRAPHINNLLLVHNLVWCVLVLGMADKEKHKERHLQSRFLKYWVWHQRLDKGSGNPERRHNNHIQTYTEGRSLSCIMCVHLSQVTVRKIDTVDVHPLNLPRRPYFCDFGLTCQSM